MQGWGPQVKWPSSSTSSSHCGCERSTGAFTRTTFNLCTATESDPATPSQMIDFFGAARSTIKFVADRDENVVWDKDRFERVVIPCRESWTKILFYLCQRNFAPISYPKLSSNVCILCVNLSPPQSPTPQTNETWSQQQPNDKNIGTLRFQPKD